VDAALVGLLWSAMLHNAIAAAMTASAEMVREVVMNGTVGGTSNRPTTAV
jgi:hypothetical protein